MSAAVQPAGQAAPQAQQYGGAAQPNASVGLASAAGGPPSAQQAGAQTAQAAWASASAQARMISNNATAAAAAPPPLDEANRVGLFRRARSVPRATPDARAPIGSVSFAR